MTKIDLTKVPMEALQAEVERRQREEAALVPGSPWNWVATEDLEYDGVKYPFGSTLDMMPLPGIVKAIREGHALSQADENWLTAQYAHLARGAGEQLGKLREDDAAGRQEVMDEYHHLRELVRIEDLDRRGLR